MLCHKHLDPQENNSFGEKKGMVLPLSRGKSVSSDCNCPFLTVDAKSSREEGFLHPTCPRRVRTHTSVIYHHAISTCQLDNDFSPGVSKLEMLFRLQKQLHVLCILSQCRAASMQMEGILNLPGLRPQHTPQPSLPRKTNTNGGRTCAGESSTWRDAMTIATCASFSIHGSRALLQGLAAYRKQFSLASASAIDYFPPFIFSPFPPFLDQKCLLHSPPLVYGLKGKKGQTLQAQQCWGSSANPANQCKLKFAGGLICSELAHLVWLVFLDNDHRGCSKFAGTYKAASSQSRVHVCLHNC